MRERESESADEKEGLRFEKFDNDGEGKRGSSSGTV